MNALRPWIALLMGVTFVAGVAAGILLEKRAQQSTEAWGVLAGYERMLIEHFELPPERAVYLHGFLREYEQEVEKIQELHRAELLARIEPELRVINQKYEPYVRAVIPPGKLAEFDQAARPVLLHSVR